jgi:hypothetical protein
MDADRDLTVRPLADRPAVLASHPDRRLPHLGNNTSSTTHTSGPITSDSRSAIRRRTGSGSHGDWFTNCCRACMFPSGSRSAIGCTDFRRPSSIRPRR